ncbi:hypothetical protein CMO89_02590 [Candidatus Woesearchaeota archaeon]|nr:hypothetical protein [Candidatus Woesearchaeota archaeon]|tara:strand:+ start:5099 stop:5371 length:273 start_codon:yes stop_codon:yes gene_type:complete
MEEKSLDEYRDLLDAPIKKYLRDYLKASLDISEIIEKLDPSDLASIDDMLLSTFQKIEGLRSLEYRIQNELSKVGADYFGDGSQETDEIL